MQRIKDIKLPLADLTVDDFRGFDPSRPDRFEDVGIPPSPLVTNVTPLGN